MKRIIMLAMVLVMMLVSIGGCWVGWDDGRRGGRLVQTTLHINLLDRIISPTIISLNFPRFQKPLNLTFNLLRSKMKRCYQKMLI